MTRSNRFHRRESPSQTPADAAAQMASAELHGGEGKLGGMVCVRAYVGPLPSRVRGIEFETDVAPHPSQAPHEAHWYLHTPGVETREVAGRTIAVISVRIIRNTQC